MSPRTVLDLGTGTGCLLLATLHEFPQAFGVGVDLSWPAAALAQANAAALGMADRAVFWPATGPRPWRKNSIWCFPTRLISRRRMWPG